MILAMMVEVVGRGRIKLWNRLLWIEYHACWLIDQNLNKLTPLRRQALPPLLRTKCASERVWLTSLANFVRIWPD